MGQEELMKQMEADRKRAGILLEKIRNGKYISETEFASCVRGYTLARFSLSEGEKGDEIAELAARGMAKLMGVTVESLKRKDRPSGCNYTTSVTDKKVLLILTLTRELGVEFPPGQVPKIKTLSQLSQSLWQELSKRQE